MRKVRHPISATYTKLIESKPTTRNVSRLYGVPYKFADVADIFCYFLFIERTESIIYSFRDVSLSRNGPVRDAGHFFLFRDCTGQIRDSCRVTLCHGKFMSICTSKINSTVQQYYMHNACQPSVEQ